jgi:hypothetical protein
LSVLCAVFNEDPSGGHLKISEWLIVQMVVQALSVMKDPGSNLCADICSFYYQSAI